MIISRFKRLAAAASLAIAALTLSGVASAALFYRAGDMVYDDVLNVTWLLDSNYAKTTGYVGTHGRTDGFLNWADAVKWADQLVYGGYDDWRLPTLSPINGTSWKVWGSGEELTSGGWDYGWNISYPGRADPYDPASLSAGFTGNELAYMFYVNLGNLARFAVGDYWPDVRPGTIGVDWGLVNRSFEDGLTGETYSFNIDLWFSEERGVVAAFWSDLPASDAAESFVWSFVMDGFNDPNNPNMLLWAWAVRDGDVLAAASPLPEPRTSLLLLVALLVTLGVRAKWASPDSTDTFGR